MRINDDGDDDGFEASVLLQQSQPNQTQKQQQKQSKSKHSTTQSTMIATDTVGEILCCSPFQLMHSFVHAEERARAGDIERVKEKKKKECTHMQRR